jgi:hypothetical protein
LGSNSVHRAAGFRTGLSDGPLRSVACVLDLLPGIDHRPDGHNETQDTHGQADYTRDVSKRSDVTEDYRQGDHRGEDARPDYPCFPGESHSVIGDARSLHKAYPNSAPSWRCGP